MEISLKILFLFLTLIPLFGMGSSVFFMLTYGFSFYIFRIFALFFVFFILFFTHLCYIVLYYHKSVELVISQNGVKLFKKNTSLFVEWEYIQTINMYINCSFSFLKLYLKNGESYLLLDYSGNNLQLIKNKISEFNPFYSNNVNIIGNKYNNLHKIIIISILFVLIVIIFDYIAYIKSFYMLIDVIIIALVPVNILLSASIFNILFNNNYARKSM